MCSAHLKRRTSIDGTWVEQAKRSMSSLKEREILERQRRLAAQISGNGGGGNGSAAGASLGGNGNGGVRPASSASASGSSDGGWTTKKKSSSRTIRPTTGRGGWLTTAARPRPPPPPGPPPPPPGHPGMKKQGTKKSSKTTTIDLTESPIDLTGGQKSKARTSSTNSRPAASAAIGKLSASSSSSFALARPRNRSRPAAAATSAAGNNSNNVRSSAESPVRAADVIAAARARYDMKVGGSASSATAAVSSTATLKHAAIRKKPSGATARIPTTIATATGNATSGKKSTMASLLRSAGANAAALQSKPTVHYPKIEQEDFWRNIRDWDFVKDFNNERAGGRNRGNKANTSNNNRKRSRTGSADDASGGGRSRSPTPPPSTSNDKPLPDTFDSVRQYTALWAPLCLAEARAQILSEAWGNVPYWNKKGKGPFPVVVAPLKRDVGNNVDYITVQIKARKKMSTAELESISPSFRPNDIVLLARDEETINRASRGDLNLDGSGASAAASGNDMDSRLGIVGHTESTRRTVDGLWVKVSRKHWLAAGRQNMCLLNVGCNVTALREFNALCRLSAIPLADHVMGKDLVSATGSGAGGGLVERTKSKANMMQKMGGSSALGKGFVAYAKQKFNPSQLLAISASATEYGEGGFTLIKGPPGTGKTTTLVALLNSLHIRQFNKYYEAISDIAKSETINKGQKIGNAAKSKPRLLVCAPSNAAVDNVILKIMENGFIDGNGTRYNPSIVRVGVGQSDAVRACSLESKVDNFLSDARDAAKIEAAMNGYRAELQRIQGDIFKLRKRIHALSKVPYPLSRDWEARVDETDFDARGVIYFVNHKTQSTTYEVPPPPEPGEQQYPISSMPEFRAYVGRIVKLVERHNSITSKLEKFKLAQSLVAGGRGSQASQLRMMLETHFLDETHIVFTTLGTAGNRALESSAKFEVIVVDEAAQSVEPSTLVGLQLGSKHAILVGDPQQLPATIFSFSGRTTKYDRSLFQRLEEAGHEVHLLNKQYRMHPDISEFPRRIFYGGELTDGPNVEDPEYGMPLRKLIQTQIPAFRPLTVLDLDSSEERGGTSLSNSAEARLAIHLYDSLKRETGGVSARSRVAVITPYAQQASLLRRMFAQHLGPDFQRLVEVNTVDAFQGREANIVIFSCVRAAGSQGIGFLSDVRRMNVAITRAKFFLFVIARCRSIVVNPYWRDFVKHARINRAVVPVPMLGAQQSFPDLKNLRAADPPPRLIVPVAKKAKA